MKLDRDRLVDQLVELIRRASTELPPDVKKALEAGRDSEPDGSTARRTLTMMLENQNLACTRELPICQDTGTNVYRIRYPAGVRQKDFRAAIQKATTMATERSYLRPNTVDPRTEKNIASNLGEGAPQIWFEERDDDRELVTVELMLKGGGCENTGAQYSLPASELGADRDLTGVKKVVLDCVQKALGKGCAPGALGVCMGGDRAYSLLMAKKQHFRPLHDVNPDPALAKMEREILDAGNRLGIGPMGFGGKTTVFACKVTSATRLPASYFVSISYMCWAFRRACMILEGDGREAVYQPYLEAALAGAGAH
ncbi:MAG: fumarate hydratase [Planctomycetota bacterium]